MYKINSYGFITLRYKVPNFFYFIMPSARNRRRRPRQNNRRLMGNSTGSILAMPFLQNTQGSFNTVVGTTNRNVTYAMCASDLQSGRMIKIVSVRLDFAPTVSGSGFPLAQILIEDPSTNNLVPVTRQVALNMTTRTTISARFPVQPLGYVQAGSGATAFALRVQATAVLGLQYTMEVRFLVARDDVN